MGTINTYRLSVLEASHVLPNDFLVSERGPSMCKTFFNKLLSRPTSRSYKERFSSDTVIKSDFLAFLDFLNKFFIRLERISRVLSIVSIEATNLIGCLPVTAIPEVLHYWLLSSSMSFLTHDSLIALQRILILLHLFVSMRTPT